MAVPEIDTERINRNEGPDVTSFWCVAVSSTELQHTSWRLRRLHWSLLVAIEAPLQELQNIWLSLLGLRKDDKSSQGLW